VLCQSPGVFIPVTRESENIKLFASDSVIVTVTICGWFPAAQ